MEEFKHIIDERAVDGAIASSELDNQMPREATGAAELTATKKTPHVEHQNAETQGKYTKRSRIDRTHAARTDSSVATVMVGRSRRQREADPQMRPASSDEKSVINPRQPTHARKRTSHANRWDTSSMDSSSTSCSQTSSVPNNASSTDEPTESSMSEGGYEGSKSGSGSSCDDRRNSHVHHTVQWSRDEKHTKATSPSRKGLSLFEDGESPVSSSSNAGPDGPGNDGLELSIQDPLPGGNRKAAFAQSSASKDQSRGDRASSTGEKSETSSSGIFSVLNPRTNLKEGRRIDFKARADCDAITNLKRTGGSYQSAVNFSSDTQINSYETRNLIDVSSGASLAGASVSTSFLGGGAAKSSENETATKTSNVSSERSFCARKEDIADTNSAIGNGSNGIKSKTSSKQKVALHQEEGELRPAPYFYYVDRSREEDDDPLTPLTPPARVPIFPAKMHALLTRDDLRDVIRWMPHGRSFDIVNPREFEHRVIPTYFEHSKVSSFVRQAQGWGFRKLTKGRERHSFYNEYFLRGLPHLCKKMTRPSLTKKVVCNPNYEPDLFEISINHPVPERIPHDDMNLTIIEAVGVCILEGGPKARLPVVHGMNFLNPPSNAISNLSTQSTSAVNGDSSKNSVSSSSSAVSSKHGNHREPCQPNIQPYQNAHNGNNLNNHCTQINNGNTEQHQDIQALLQQQYNMMQVLNQQQSQQPSQNTRNQNDQNHLNTQTSNGQSEPHHELQALLQQQYNLILAPNQQQHQQQRQQQPAIPALFQTFQSNSNSTSVASSMQQQNQPSSLQNPSSFLASLLDNGNLASLLGGQRSNNFSILQDFFTNSLQQQPQLRSNSTVFEGTNTSLTGNTRSSGTNLHVSQDMLNNFFESLLGGQPNNNNGGGLGTNQLQQLLAQSTSRSQSQQVRDSSSIQPAIPLMDETISAILVRAVTAGAQLGAEVSSRAENARGANGSQDFNSQSQNGNRG